MPSKYEKQVSLRGLRLGEMRKNGVFALSTPIKNSSGQHIGNFTTTGVGAEEHQRRLGVVFKGLARKPVATPAD